MFESRTILIIRDSPQNFLCKSVKNNGYKLLILTKNAQCPHSTNTEKPKYNNKAGRPQKWEFLSFGVCFTNAVLAQIPQPSRRVLSILPAPAHAGSSPGRAQRVQDAPCAAAGALDHEHRPRIRPAMLPPIHAGAPAAGTCCRSDQSPGAGPGQEKDFHK